jgi:threonine/homoserine/homoserine lactone efflux protein
MDLGLWARGTILGFSIAAPVGPIGVLCIRRTLAYGRLRGLVSGLGAATADMLYGAVAAFGLTAISDLLLALRLWIHLLGAALLVYLGVSIARARPASIDGPAMTPRLGVSYASTLGLTLTNPSTILSFLVIFASLGLVGTHGDYGAAGSAVLGVFSGSALWWLILSSGVGLLRDRVTPRGLRWINLVSGSILLLFALVALLSA